MFSGSDVRIGEHRIQGIGDGLIPEIVEMRLLKRVYTGGSNKAVGMVRISCRKNGVMVEINVSEVIG
jgi:cysteine synthase